MGGHETVARDIDHGVEPAKTVDGEDIDSGSPLSVAIPCPLAALLNFVASPKPPPTKKAHF